MKKRILSVSTLLLAALMVFAFTISAWAAPYTNYDPHKRDGYISMEKLITDTERYIPAAELPRIEFPLENYRLKGSIVAGGIYYIDADSIKVLRDTPYVRTLLVDVIYTFEENGRPGVAISPVEFSFNQEDHSHILWKIGEVYSYSPNGRYVVAIDVAKALKMKKDSYYVLPTDSGYYFAANNAYILAFKEFYSTEILEGIVEDIVEMEEMK